MHDEDLHFFSKLVTIYMIIMNHLLLDHIIILDHN